MKEMNIVKISATPVAASALPTVLDEAQIAFHPVDRVNWSAYPYRPEVFFRMAYTDDAILLHFKVKEASVRARFGSDNEPVWQDSCVEFFSIPAGDGVYYNIECNCIGTLLMAAGQARENREPAPLSLLAEVQRWASLGREPFAERFEETAWEVALMIPYRLFFKHNLTSLAGKQVRANFYKCGDALQTPHFLSWHPIAVEKPDFHRPDFFGSVKFLSNPNSDE